jgi:hypothetical protein
MLERAILSDVRKGINEYRDMCWNGLLVPRNQIFKTLFATSLAAYALLVISLLTGASDAVIYFVSGIFLVGMLIGVSHRLLDDMHKESGVDDEGLSDARLLATPCFSGVAAVCGVAFLALMPNKSPLLNVIFDPNSTNSLLLAAVFGLSPGLLFSLLQKQADTYKGGLKSTKAGTDASKPGATP